MIHVFRFLKKRPSKKRTTKESRNMTASTCDAQTPSTSEITTKGSEDSSIRHRTDSNGRRFRDDVAYVLPVDDTEMDRVHQQHWMLKVLFDGNFKAPVESALEEGMQVLDSGCGPATWTLELANTYPKSTFHGTDISSNFPKTIKPANCNFYVHNITERSEFQGNYFGFIHQRLLVAGLLVDDWEKVLQEHWRTLAPGGWIELMELPVAKTVNIGPKLAALFNIFVEMCKAKGLHWQITNHLEGMLERLGFVNIKVQEVELPINHESTVSKLAWEDMLDLYKAIKPVIVKSMPELADDERYLEYLEACGEECNKNKMFGYFYRIWGQKPPTA
ncbi:hypothetical protein O0I10_000518 [Lichtheimia ornata]|uniref:Methyltransferase domain-containing protein n=1 Tax=Lichtheimia ornata TaxID=688661 RepID=A0AAD7Y3T4_9FUNG|nr:uncharacterized protein O0I10_000518 [Lichtheimia ornata]KAJ8663280.1 hypothetical protein O0I10_000518 [Lichtheimia ornata]